MLYTFLVYKYMERRERTLTGLKSSRNKTVKVKMISLFFFVLFENCEIPDEF